MKTKLRVYRGLSPESPGLGTGRRQFRFDVLQDPEVNSRFYIYEA